jgi:hypothetical protein
MKIKTALLLGISSLIRVFFYRFTLKTGLNPVRHLKSKEINSFFFKPRLNDDTLDLDISPLWWQKHSYFSWFNVDSAEIPDWFINPFNQKKFKNYNKKWWEIPDFDPDFGDIKIIWEASRFDWVVFFAQRASQGEKQALKKLNNWLFDWNNKNNSYFGPNWKCGQEASIRLIHLAMAAIILDQIQDPETALINMVEIHLERISPTISYAIGQNNNHGISEAAALFIGGSWLSSLGYKKGYSWAKKGRKWLENRAPKLIGSQGTFSQYSVVYHRLMLDSYSFVEVWRRKLDLPLFSENLYSKLQLGSIWLYSFIFGTEGDCPNIGANDGSNLIQLGDYDYRDFRPSVQLAMALFLEKRAFAIEGHWNHPLKWLGIEVPLSEYKDPGSSNFPDGGFSVLSFKNAKACFRYPVFKFRPGQSDALHLDLWLNGKCILGDAGTYSYNDEEKLSEYFKGTKSHNTVEFDDRNQMPQISRFLFGEWLKSKNVRFFKKNDKVAVQAGYKDYVGAQHFRKVLLRSNSILINDDVKGFQKRAILRWRLKPGKWNLDNQKIACDLFSLNVHSSVPVHRIELVKGYESLYYNQKETIPVLEIEIRQKGRIVTEINFLK